MDFPQPIGVQEIAELIGAEIVGDPNRKAFGINEIHKVREGDITFVDIEKYYKKSLSSAATIIIINKRTECPPGKTLLLVDDPFTAYDSLVRRYRKFEPLEVERSASAVIHPSAIIEPHVMIGNEVVIGEDCYIQSHCYIGSHTTIGDRVRISAGCMIGTDAFYFKDRGTHLEQWQSGGSVVIESDVFIGASCTINKGVSGATRIGEGSKLDSQVHIGHGAVIGKHCTLAGQVGIGGKTLIGDHVRIYGQAGISNNLVIGDRVIILGKAGVTKDLPDGGRYFGLPAKPAREFFRDLARSRKGKNLQ